MKASTARGRIRDEVAAALEEWRGLAETEDEAWCETHGDDEYDAEERAAWRGRWLATEELAIDALKTLAKCHAGDEWDDAIEQLRECAEETEDELGYFRSDMPSTKLLLERRPWLGVCLCSCPCDEEATTTDKGVSKCEACLDHSKLCP